MENGIFQKTIYKVLHAAWFYALLSARFASLRAELGVANPATHALPCPYFWIASLRSQ
jgi:hypothetical protein